MWHTSVSSITYRDISEKVNEPVKHPKSTENKQDNIYILIDENVSESVKERLYSIINSLQHQPNQNRIDLIERTQKGRATTERYIKILKDANIVEFIGSDKTGGYYLTQKAKDRISNK
jgi:ATP-dependent DNA helicase RecG